jgi:beta-phosphoglucomutase-like phosphatase (HAD superfamily)
MDSLPDSPGQTAFLFDLDGTLIDSVYQHVLAWREALQSVGVSLAVWKIHRRIGMSGGLFVNALVRELETPLDADTLAGLPGLHAEAFIRRYDSVQALPGARELLTTLSEHEVPWAIATSGPERYAGLARELLAVDKGSGCCQAATDARSSSIPAPTGSSRTPPTCWLISTRWAFAAHTERSPPPAAQPRGPALAPRGWRSRAGSRRDGRHRR